MAEFINSAQQTVEVNANVLFSDTVVEPCCKVRHREGSGIFTLKGGRYIISFGGNISIPAEETGTTIVLAIALNGEALQGGIMEYTPGAVGRFGNVSKLVEINVPCNCCYTLSVKNVGTIPMVVDDANLVTIRENVQEEKQ